MTPQGQVNIIARLLSEGPRISVLPQVIEPRKFAQKRVDLEGFLEVSALSRLHGEGNDVVSAYAKLAFDRDDQGRPSVTGSISATVSRCCQRCLNAVEEKVNCTVHWVLVWDDLQAKQLTDAEPWIVTEEAADVYEAIEEEVLLGLPVVALHSEQCVPESAMQSSPDVSEEEGGSDNPFAQLAVLKQRVEDDEA